MSFRYSPNGKPSLEKTGCWFSLSHCASAVVCAIASSDIGVDVESMSRCEHLVAKANRFFSDTTVKQIEHGGLLPPVTAFTVFWTCLESQVKLKDSSIFSERRIFELVPDIDNHYRNNQNISLLSLVTQTGDVISLASRSDFDVCLWQPVGIENKETEKKAFQLMWQPCAKNAVKLLIDANGYT